MVVRPPMIWGHGHEAPIHAPTRVFSTASTTFATSARRTGAPLRYATVMRRNWFASVSCPDAWRVYERVGPQSTPVGWFTLWLEMASRTSSVPIPRLASAEGSSCTRTAYFCEPGTIEMRWPISVSPYSSSSDSGTVFEVRPM